MGAPTLLLLRHASAGAREEWAGDDASRPLDALGQAHASALPDHLRGFVGARPRLLASPTVRCRATLEPLAAAWGQTVGVDARLAETPPPLRSEDGWPDAAWLGARAVAAVDAALEDGQAGTLVVCSHGEVLPALLAALLGRADEPGPLGAPDLTSKALPKGGGWLLRWEGPAPVVVEIAAPGQS